MTEQVIPTEENPLRSVEYVAKVLDFEEATVRQWLRQGKLKGVKVGGVWKIPQVELVRFVNERFGESDA